MSIKPAKRVGILITLISLTLASAFPGLAMASTGELAVRSATLSTSVAGSTGVTATFLVTPSTNAVVEAVGFQMCTSPLSAVGCTIPTGATMVSASAGAQLENGSAIGNTYGSPAYTGSTGVSFSNASGNSFNGTSDTLSFAVNGINLPTAANTEFYFRMTTYSNTGATSVIDFGGLGLATSQQLTVAANVQEDLQFCVGTSGTDCSSITGSAVNLTPDEMSPSAPSTGGAVMAAATNATGGYVITYNATPFSDSTGDTICTGACISNMLSGQFLTAGGNEQFGFNMAANTGGSFGTFGDGPNGGSGAVTAPYGSNNQIAYSTAGSTQVASAAGPTTNTLYTMSYGANVTGTTKPGIYNATQTFIATGTY